jgi:hypothetical protein
MSKGALNRSALKVVPDISLEFGRRRWEKLIHGRRVKTDDAELNEPLLFPCQF